MRASVFRLSPLLLLAVALMALAVLFAPGAQPAQAQTTTVWSATLSVVVGTSTGLTGCSIQPPCSSQLTDDDFTYGGVEYTFTTIYVSGGSLNVTVNKAIPAALKSALTLHVGSSQFALAGAAFTGNDRVMTWTNSGLSWSAGDTVSLSLTEPSTTTPTTPTLPPGTTEYWSETLAVTAVDYGFGCGYRTGQPQCDAALADDDFRYGGVEHTVELVHVAYGDTLQFILDREPRDRNHPTNERSRMALYVNERQFLVRDALVSYGIAENNVWTNETAWVLTWTGSGLSWSDGDSVLLTLVTLPAGGLQSSPGNVPPQRGGSGGTDGDLGVVHNPNAGNPYASLIADVKLWRDDPCCASNTAHTDRWDRVLLALGESVADASLQPMTASDAQGLADRGWNRWERVAEALRELETAGDAPEAGPGAGPEPANQAPTVSATPADVSGLEAGATREVSLAGVFHDPDGDALTITGGPDDDAIVTVEVASDGSRLTLTGVSEGTAIVLVFAADPSGASVFTEFNVSVVPAPEPETEGLSEIAARYDADANGKIDVSEYRRALNDYAARTITYSELLEVVRAYQAS